MERARAAVAALWIAASVAVPGSAARADPGERPGGACAFSLRLGGPGFTATSPRVAAAPDGGAFFGATFDGTLRVGPDRWTSNGHGDLLLGRIDPRGRPVWIKRFGDAAMQELRALAVDPAGDLLVAGVTGGGIDLGLGPIAGDRPGIFVGKLDPQGRALWVRRFEADEILEVSALGAGSDGDIVVGGSLEGRADFGGVTLDNHGAFPFVLRLDRNGRARWARSFQGSVDQTVTGVALDPEGSALVAEEAKRVSIDGQVFRGPGSSNAFAAALDPRGSLRWARMYGEREDSAITSLAPAKKGPLVAGWFTGAIDLGAGRLDGGGAFAAGLGAAGRALWSRRIAGTWPSIAAGASGEPWITATFDRGLLVARLGAGGELRWERRFPGSIAPGPAAAASPAGRLLLAAVVTGGLDLGCGPLAAGGRDVVVAAIDP